MRHIMNYYTSIKFALFISYQSEIQTIETFYEQNHLKSLIRSKTLFRKTNFLKINLGEFHLLCLTRLQFSGKD